MALLDQDRLFPVEDKPRQIARALYETVADLPIISPHGHCDPQWFAENERFPNPSELFVTPDHYVFRMLVSQGVSMDDLGVPRADGSVGEADPRKIWRIFAEHFHLFRGTPSSLWLNHSFEHVFGLDIPFNTDTADAYYDHIEAKLAEDAFRPRALFESFGIECLATTEGALDDLKWHAQIRDSDWNGRVITTYRPDAVVDPEFEGFAENVEKFGALTGEDTATWSGYLNAHRLRRAFFKEHGATASDHGHATARTEALSRQDAEALFQKAIAGKCSKEEADAFRGQMLTEMARMSLDDGLTLQIHAGSVRNHSSKVLASHGRDKGFDIPSRTDYVHALRPLLSEVGMERDLNIILFTLDETVYGRELAPLAGAYPALRLGPPWWFFDSYEGIMRFREQTTETAGFYNTAGFNDDTRAFCSIPARHDVSRRSDCAYLATLVATGRLGESDAFEVAHDLTYRLAKEAYRL
ncbi:MULTISPECIES: glucuronate isomerase [Halocynthiibacter]|uniref:Uronate isomerase n=1 Tax=Halocynthiibacter halioticoli TaxID=2986804 RepID=A0AAE3J2C6_9RHOB|nr:MULTISPECIES: glucuronate isomerase [Halocynthiibacter]MCV6825426.1 glucuronate isomerase [Halocynthiibacter halioticoli]MCW4058427.1 glucuronate isomerase [Halocynthiibacter sp. SDUM655004]